MSSSNFELLPIELIFYIFGFITEPRAFTSLSLTCRTIAQVALDLSVQEKAKNKMKLDIKIKSDTIIQARYYVLPNKLKHGICEMYYIYGNISERINYKNGIILHSETFYFNGTTCKRKTYENSTPIEQIEFYQSGSVKEIYVKLNAQKSTTTKFRESGTIQFFEQNEARVTSCISYYEDGITKKEEYILRKGIWHGTFKSYHPNAIISFTCDYVYGKINGIGTRYHPNGNVFSVASYKNDELDGEFKKYNEYGKLLGQTIYKNGKARNNNTK